MWRCYKGPQSCEGPWHRAPVTYVGQSHYVWPMLGFEIIDAALVPALAIALFGGLISFASPCVLPIVPPYLAYMGGITMQDMAEERAARPTSLNAAHDIDVTARPGCAARYAASTPTSASLAIA